MYKVAFYPFVNNTNKYISMTQKCIKEQGIELLDFDDIVKRKRFAEVNAIYLNWFESVEIKGMWKRFLILCFCKRKKIKIVYVFHNKKVHEGKLVLLRKVFLDTMLRMSDEIVILSKASKQYLPSICQNKSFYIPHPNYIECYSAEELLKAEKAENADTLKMLFVGAVRPYKNIELLIESFIKLSEKYDNVFLTIAGKPIDKKYEEELKSMVKGNEKIITDFTFIPDEALPNLVMQHDILVLPYNIESSMNSGTAILSFSFARTVVSPKIATIEEFDQALVYSYEYEDEKEHIKALYEQLENVMIDYEKDSSIIKNKGRKLYDAVKEGNNEKLISKLYNQLFQ